MLDLSTHYTADTGDSSRISHHAQLKISKYSDFYRYDISQILRVPLGVHGAHLHQAYINSIPNN